MKKVTLAIISGCLFFSSIYADSLRVIANPSARAYACMVTDSLNNRIILFGGGRAWSDLHNDVWSLDLNTEGWKPVYPIGSPPTPRFMASAVYYPDSNAMILVGGRDSSIYFDEVWLLKLTPGAETWRQAPVSSIHPPFRSSATCVWDRFNNRLIYFGGESNIGFYNDVWQFNLNDWTWHQITPTGEPPTARFGHSAIYDPVDQRMIMFGGFDGSYKNDVWELSLISGSETWTHLNPSGSIPGIRAWQFTIRDPVNNTMIMGFGKESFSCYQDIWELRLDPLLWSHVIIFPPTMREGSCAAYNWLNMQIVIFGGAGWLDGDTYSLFNDSMAIAEFSPIYLFPGLDLKVLGTPSRLTYRFIATVPLNSKAAITIYDQTGRVVRSLRERIKGSNGQQIFEWNGKDDKGLPISSGTYFIRLETDVAKHTEKMIVIR